MNKILAASSLALTVFFLNPIQSNADWNTPQTRHGYGWLQGRALNTMPWLHFHGPLYNYGPYTTPGHVPMYVKNPHIGAYTPAYPSAYYGYEAPIYYPNTIAPVFPGRPMGAPAGPNYVPLAASEPPMAAPIASAPATSEQRVATQPAASNYYGNSRPAFFGSFRTSSLRR
jgi:hypothetical protein